MKTIVFVFAALLMTFPFTIYGQHGTHSAWGAALEIPKTHETGSARGSVGNTMVITSEEKIVVFFTETFPFPGNASKIYYTSSENDGVDWTDPEVFEPATWTIGSCCPNIALDLDDNIHIVWHAKNPLAVFYSKMDVDFNLLLDSVRISDFVDHHIHDPTLTVDRKNRVHVMWHDGDPKASDHAAEIQYVRSPDGGESWNAQQTISDEDNRHSAFPRADFSGALGDTLAISWRDSINPVSWNVMIAVTENGGESWMPKTAAGGAGKQWDPGLVVDKHGYFQLNFHEYPPNDPFNGARVKFGTSTDYGETWSDFQTISEDERSQLTTYNYDFKNDHLWVFWKDERDIPGVDLMAGFSTDRGANWIEEGEWVTDQEDLPVGFKSSAISPNGTVGINYEVLDEISGASTLYYRQRDAISSVEDPPMIEEGEMVIFPNPSKGHFQLLFSEPLAGDGYFKIVNLYGQIVKFETFDSPGNSISVHIPSFLPGSYLVVVRTATQFFQENLFLIK